MATVKTAIPTKALEPIEAVSVSLKAACKASGSMLQACKEAAKAAARQLDANLPLIERINKVVLCYKDVIGGDNNVRANFKDGLTLLACAQTPVSIEVRGVEVHTTAEKALDMPKHAMKAAAQAVRAENGIGRTTAAKRKPQTPVAKAPTATPVDQMMRIIASNFEAENDAFIAKLKATLAANGYLLTKK
jgi:hypothetical protein